MVGSTFANFTILERLAHGGMAEIYLVVDGSGQRSVLRVLLPQYRFDWTHSRRFRTGCEVTSRLNHPNVARCTECGKFRGRRYCILEYVEGANLKECILRNDPQLRANQMKLLTGLAAGLAHIHERGFLHLDFKPENVLISRSYDPKIIDFDLAIPRPATPKKVAKLSGTPTYLAPEQLMRQPVDERADIFAYGLTVYEMLSGKKPITGNTRDEVLQKYADFNQHLKPLRTHVPTIPPVIERVVLKCLEKDVARRYPSMSLVVRDLQS
ncbi:MAG: Serine/threonine-protein kinase StkP [Verrucomicrobiae bacterium]|nr:Serine/threonine-protein kinase StkP [Verrucomicrobiae bacterium]